VKPIAYVTGTYGGHFTVEPINRSLVLNKGMALYAAPERPLTATQQAYLNVLHQPRSLNDLAAIFHCTTEGARKHLKALMSRGLITRDARFRRKSVRDKGAWAWYYQRKENRG